MISKGFDHLNLSVKSLSESINFYSKIFDFAEVEQGVSDNINFAVLKLNTSMLCLYEFPERQFLDRFALRKQKIHGLNHFAMNVVNEKEFLKRLTMHDIEIKYGGAVKYPHSVSYYISDPTGYEIEAAVWNDGEITF